MNSKEAVFVLVLIAVTASMAQAAPDDNMQANAHLDSFIEKVVKNEMVRNQEIEDLSFANEQDEGYDSAEKQDGSEAFLQELLADEQTPTKVQV